MEMLLDNEWVLSIILAVSFLILNILGNFTFHAITKGNHFREWKEFEPLDTPIPKAVNWATIQHRRELRETAYKLLVKTLSLKLNDSEKHLTSKHIIYAILEHFSPHCLPNSAIDNDDIKFTTEVNKVILAILEIEVHELRKFMQEKFPNSNF